MMICAMCGKKGGMGILGHVLRPTFGPAITAGLAALIAWGGVEMGWPAAALGAVVAWIVGTTIALVNRPCFQDRG